MEKYIIKLSKNASKDLLKIKISGRKNDIKKIETFLLELENNPRIGIGNPKQLKHFDGEI